MAPRKKSPSRSRYHRRAMSSAALKWYEHKRCFHRWTVFVAGKDGKEWRYCTECGVLHGRDPESPRPAA